MNTIIRLITERGFTLMLCGMCTAAVGVVGYMYFSSHRAIFEQTFYPGISITVAFIGFAIYVTGRISLAIQRRRSQYRTAANEKDEDE